MEKQENAVHVPLLLDPGQVRVNFAHLLARSLAFLQHGTTCQEGSRSAQVEEPERNMQKRETNQK